mmetsp:Transcript_25629/g.24925  ORF Transcript_25629/g.24925 Transcript_25629/m.24925 type:complete len:83 (+) Transcript_25629:884-1132(+)
MEREQAELERRRNMTDQEREAENLRLGTDNNERKQKVAYNFMQKFYKLGPYYQHLDREVYQRDYNMPTGEDKMDKSVLPAVL